MGPRNNVYNAFCGRKMGSSGPVSQSIDELCAILVDHWLLRTNCGFREGWGDNLSVVLVFAADSKEEVIALSALLHVGNHVFVECVFRPRISSIYRLNSRSGAERQLVWPRTNNVSILLM
jgi:hypothetical protein